MSTWTWGGWARGSLSSSSRGCHAPSDAAKTTPLLRMVVEELEEVLVPEIPGRVHPEQPLARRLDNAIRPTPAIVKESWPYGQTVSCAASAHRFYHASGALDVLRHCWIDALLQLWLCVAVLKTGPSLGAHISSYP